MTRWGRPEDLAVALGVNVLVFGLAAWGLGGVDVPDPPLTSPPTTAIVQIPRVGIGGGAGAGTGEAAAPEGPMADEREADGLSSAPVTAEKDRRAARRKREPQPELQPEVQPRSEAQPDPEDQTQPDAEPQPEPAEQEAADRGPGGEDSVSPEGAASTGSAGVAGTDGEGSAVGTPGGDPLGARAVAYYRTRLGAWFARHFRVRGSGLPRDQLSRMKVRVRVDVDEERRIQGHTLLAADHEAFRRAADATMQALTGSQLPEPPPGYPGALQRQITITFTCTETACD